MRCLLQACLLLQRQKLLCCSFASLSVVLPLFLSPHSHSFSHFPALPSACDLGSGARGDASPLGERNQSREGGRERKGGSPHKFVLADSARAGTRLSAASGGRSSGKVKPTGAAEQESLIQPGDADRNREGGSVLHWADAQKWLLNLSPASALSASSLGFSIQLLAPGLGNSSSRY